MKLENEQNRNIQFVYCREKRERIRPMTFFQMNVDFFFHLHYFVLPVVQMYSNPNNLHIQHFFVVDSEKKIFKIA